MADRTPIGPGAAFARDDAQATPEAVAGREGDAPWGPSARRFVVWLLVGILLMLGVIFAFDWYVDATGVTGRATKWRVVENAKDRTVKLDRYDALTKGGSTADTAPQTMLLGSSRVMKFQPSVAEQLTGERTFNAAVSGGTPEDVLLFTKYIEQRQSKRFPHLVWGIDVDAFRDKQLKDGLANDERVREFLSTPQRLTNTVATVGALLEWQTLKLSVESVRRGGPKTSTLADRTYADDGYQQWQLHPVAKTDDLLRRQVAAEIRQYSQDIFVRDDFHEVRPDPTEAFEHVIRIANEHGDTPTVFVTPYQPYGEQLLAKYDIQARTREVLHLLKGLQQGHGIQFELVDFTNLASFGGDPREFYDGVHMTTANTDRVLRELNTREYLARTAE